MTSVDADLRSGRRLETGRGSESIRYASHSVIRLSFIPKCNECAMHRH